MITIALQMFVSHPLSLSLALWVWNFCYCVCATIRVQSFYTSKCMYVCCDFRHRNLVNIFNLRTLYSLPLWFSDSRRLRFIVQHQNCFVCNGILCSVLCFLTVFYAFLRLSVWVFWLGCQWPRGWVLTASIDDNRTLSISH